jgi:hypothetical protein
MRYPSKTVLVVEGCKRRARRVSHIVHVRLQDPVAAAAVALLFCVFKGREITDRPKEHGQDPENQEVQPQGISLGLAASKDYP